jgi:hypothetical protein
MFFGVFKVLTTFEVGIGDFSLDIDPGDFTPENDPGDFIPENDPGDFALENDPPYFLTEIDPRYFIPEIDPPYFLIEIFYLDYEAFVAALKFFPSDPIFSPAFKIFFLAGFGGLEIFCSLDERAETRSLVLSSEDILSSALKRSSVILSLEGF